MPKNHAKKDGTHSAPARKPSKRRYTHDLSAKNSEASVATTTEEQSDPGESRPAQPANARQTQQQPPQQQQQPQQQLPIYYQAQAPMLPMQGAMQVLYALPMHITLYSTLYLHDIVFIFKGTLKCSFSRVSSSLYQKHQYLEQKTFRKLEEAQKENAGSDATNVKLQY